VQGQIMNWMINRNFARPEERNGEFWTLESKKSEQKMKGTETRPNHRQTH
jgi:hypothetical protein